MLIGLGALYGLDLASVQPNRIAPGEGYGLIAMLGLGGALLGSLPFLVIAGLARRATSSRLAIALGLVMACLMLLPWALAWFCAHFVGADEPYARAGLGAGFWVVLFVLTLALVELKGRLALSRPTWLVVWALVLGSTLTVLAAGLLDPLSLMREYQSRSDEFVTALRYHGQLVATAVGVSLLLAFTLALAMRRWLGVRRTAFAVLSLIQTIPSLALFGLLLAPLSWLAANYPLLAKLGVQGIGWTPALIALIGYSLLPMTRNAYVALEGVEPAIIESARGMGMSPRQVFLQVRLPMALPVILEGVRITSVQAIGLAAVAALIGAGGLGTFVFQGLGQAAMDMVLLGALPIIAMALVVDALLSALTDTLRRGGAYA